jgi:hypothetical protein
MLKKLLTNWSEVILKIVKYYFGQFSMQIQEDIVTSDDPKF